MGDPWRIAGFREKESPILSKSQKKKKNGEKSEKTAKSENYIFFY